MDSEVAPVPRIAAVIIYQALRVGAEGIRLLPGDTGLRVEYCKGGTWTITMQIPKHIVEPLSDHFKRMAGLPLGYRMVLEGFIPIRHAMQISQDWDPMYLDHGPLPTPVPATPPPPGVKDYDVRLSITPTRWGEKITMTLEAVEDSSD